MNANQIVRDFNRWTPPTINAVQRQMLVLLATPHDYKPPRKWSGNTPWNWRHVYEGQSEEWGITHSGEIPDDQKPRLTARDVLPLLDAGLIASDYPGTSGAMCSFHITEAGRTFIGGALA